MDSLIQLIEGGNTSFGSIQVHDTVLLVWLIQGHKLSVLLQEPVQRNSVAVMLLGKFQGCRSGISVHPPSKVTVNSSDTANRTRNCNLA